MYDPDGLNKPYQSDIEDGANPSSLTDEDIASLEQERNAMSESFEDMGRRLIKEALPRAIASITRLAESGGTDTTRLKAAMYIVDRNLGPVSPSLGTDLQKTRHEELLDSITTTIPAGAKVVSAEKFISDEEHNPIAKPHFSGG